MSCLSGGGWGGEKKERPDSLSRSDWSKHLFVLGLVLFFPCPSSTFSRSTTTPGTLLQATASASLYFVGCLLLLLALLLLSLLLLLPVPSRASLAFLSPEWPIKLAPKPPKWFFGSSALRTHSKDQDPLSQVPLPSSTEMETPLPVASTRSS